ncbi:MAG: hypothetical protein BWY21_00354 [Parcubacteria group bacterium ADurb.Bin216]|nr:MAG: hypothetical protein BWY21_00354 [Parcubacteria group bacterium ADurb.Bin216]
MAKNVDYAKVKALASSILECIGDYDEGEDPSLPKPKNDVDDGGVEPNTKFLDTAESKEGETGVGNTKEKKKSSLAMMGAMLASKVKGSKY